MVYLTIKHVHIAAKLKIRASAYTSRQFVYNDLKIKTALSTDGEHIIRIDIITFARPRATQAHDGRSKKSKCQSTSNSANDGVVRHIVVLRQKGS